MKQRIITGVIAGIVFITLLVLGGYSYAALIVLLAVVGYGEYIRMNGYTAHKGTAAIGLVATLLLAVPWSSFGIPLLEKLDSAALIWIAMLALLFITVASKNVVTIDQAAVVLLGVVYMGFGFHYMIATRLPEHGLFWTMLVFVCIWATDSGAYFVGSLIGKHPLWPQISPKKSIEGAVGGIVISVIAACIFAWSEPALLTFGRAVEFGVLIGIVGQIGDLIQSAYKRVKGIKDTGAILPGHGGVLDRVDSWLIVFPFVHLLGLIPQ